MTHFVHSCDSRYLPDSEHQDEVATGWLSLISQSATRILRDGHWTDWEDLVYRFFSVALSLAASSAKKKWFYWKAPAITIYRRKQTGRKGYSQEATPRDSFYIGLKSTLPAIKIMRLKTIKWKPIIRRAWSIQSTNQVLYDDRVISICSPLNGM